MVDWFTQLAAPWQALLAGTFTWLVTMAGALLVFLKKDLPEALLDAMTGFAGGVMIAASFWSLLAPAIEVAEARAGLPAWAVAAGGFVLGAVCLRVADRFIPHFHAGQKRTEGPPSKLRQSSLLFTAMTLHNIPEGLAVGVAFGAAAGGGEFALGAGLSGAFALSLGIGLQNFPEGIAVALPMRRAGLSRWRCFHAGHLSAIVEPLAAVLGAWLVTQVQVLLPWGLAFAAGAMIFVVIEELVPESQSNGRVDLASMSAIAGFTVMMILDVALG